MGTECTRIEIGQPAKDGGVPIRVTGELDYARADELRQALEVAVGKRTSIVRIDARGLRLLDSTALGVLLFFARELHDRGGYLELRYDTQALRRTLDVASLGKSLQLVDDTAGKPAQLR